MADEVQQLLASSAINDSIISEKDIEGLPEPVQRNLRYAGVVGKLRISTVRLKQTGLFKMKQGQNWKPYSALQYFTIDPPGFIWQVKLKFLPLIWVSGRDSYFDGKASMQMKLLSFIKVVDAAGPKLDQGAMLRYLSEIVWFPTAYLSDYITWEAIDVNSAKATMRYGGVTASAMFHYDEEGRFIDFVADRYMGTDDNAELEKWTAEISQYSEISGMMIPVDGKATWNLAIGDFTYIDLKITDIEYDNPTKY